MTNTAAYLEKYDMEDLYHLAVNTGVTDEKALGKDELITKISNNLLNRDVLEYAYLYSDDAALESWRHGSEDGELGKNLSLTDVYGLYIMGLAYESLNEEDNFFILEEVLDKFEAVHTEENREARTGIQRQLNLIRAALHLYGVVEFKQIVHLFKKYYGMDVTIEEVVDMVNRSPYVITVNEKNREFVIDDMTDEQYEIIRNAQQKYKYYEPEFGKFIKFSNPGYIDESAAHETLKKWVSEHLNTNVASDYELYLHVLRMVISGRKREDISGEIKNLGHTFESKAEEDEFFELISNIVRQTRHFQYRGKSEAELGQRTIVREVKVGRNDPCPCGSGKKYKKCCGKAV
ncbi:hypothetical protein BN1048_02010 [Jeotgalicoccus saudimassiliensis]|uniref:SEC-C motif-containing protein n=1 Tax=Jeotgalicoccus saudimassiliensis TaxID=1461582 RepID=A0A078M725_9STAP|nr:SEC-C metal-binding domain-containing protein [Jeotgalicoccus saudimassiliensis]CEA03228.1 hypothetical protein BN1048_02010 [Jeotgalicoccus saudimassiliensis]